MTDPDGVYYIALDGDKVIAESTDSFYRVQTQIGFKDYDDL